MDAESTTKADLNGLLAYIGAKDIDQALQIIGYLRQDREIKLKLQEEVYNIRKDFSKLDQNLKDTLGLQEWYFKKMGAKNWYELGDIFNFLQERNKQTDRIIQSLKTEIAKIAGQNKTVRAERNRALTALGLIKDFQQGRLSKDTEEESV